MGVGLLDLERFAEEVGAEGPVTITGAATRGGPVPGVRVVAAPAGIVRVEADEMIAECGAGTPTDELIAALDEVGQTVAVPPGGTIGGALAVGRSDIRRLGYGAVRDVLLQARFVGADGSLVTAGGQTVKNVSGFDLCRLLVGSWGTLGFMASVIVRTRPRAAHSGWYAGVIDPERALTDLYRPTSLLWDGVTVWALLEGHPGDVEAQASALGLTADAPPSLPLGGRWSVPPRRILEDPASLAGGRFVAELGVGIVHHDLPAPERGVDAAVVALNGRVKERFDPSRRRPRPPPRRRRPRSR